MYFPFKSQTFWCISVKYLSNGASFLSLKADAAFSFVGYFNPYSANLTKWSNKLKQFVGKLPTNCLSLFEHFVGLALKGLRIIGTRRLNTYQLYNCLTELNKRSYLELYWKTTSKILLKMSKYNSELMHHISSKLTFNVWCPLKGQTYLSKLTAESQKDNRMRVLSPLQSCFKEQQQS